MSDKFLFNWECSICFYNEDSFFPHNFKQKILSTNFFFEQTFFYE
jgi:hypothetical protein